MLFFFLSLSLFALMDRHLECTTLPLRSTSSMKQKMISIQQISFEYDLKIKTILQSQRVLKSHIIQNEEESLKICKNEISHD